MLRGVMTYGEVYVCRVLGVVCYVFAVSVVRRGAESVVCVV